MDIKAAVLDAMGAESPYAASKPLTIETLQLDAPGPGEILVRIEAAGLCHSDLSVINGNRPRPMPMALGHEAAGIVEEVGPAVGGAGGADLRPGDYVVFVFVPSCGHCEPCDELQATGATRADRGRFPSTRRWTSSMPYGGRTR